MNALHLKRFWTLFDVKSREALKRERTVAMSFEHTLHPLLKNFVSNPERLVVFDRIEEIKTLTQVFYHWVQGVSFYPKMHQRENYVEHYFSAFKLIRFSSFYWLAVKSNSLKEDDIAAELPRFLQRWFQSEEVRNMSLEAWQNKILQEIQYLDLAQSNPLAFQKHLKNKDIQFRHVLGQSIKPRQAASSTFGIITTTYDHNEQCPYYIFEEQGIRGFGALTPKTFYPRLFHVEPFEEAKPEELFGLNPEILKKRF